MDIYIVCDAFLGEYLEIDEVLVLPFENLESAIIACVDRGINKYILNDTEIYGSVSDKAKFKLAKENPEEYVKGYIQVLGEEDSPTKLPDLSSPDFVIRKMRVR